MREREILVPEFYLEIVIKDQMSKAEIEKKAEQALGLTFFPDWEGDFEETDAVVAKAFGITFALYEEPSAGFVLFARNLFLYEHKPIIVRADRFIGELLRRRTGLSCEVEEGTPRVWVQMRGCAQVDTHHTLHQVAARVRAALGARLEKGFHRFRMQDNRVMESEYGFEGHLLGHRIEVYAQKSAGRVAIPRPIIVEVAPAEEFSLNEEWEKIEIPISEFLAVLLQEETDLPFAPREVASGSA